MGTFSGPVRVEWVSNSPRDMKLLEDFSYIDDKGIEWIAYKGEIINGASIPRFFWRLIGSPYVGKYREATVIHDVYCDRKDRPSKEVHRVFHEMMLANGVSELKAQTMYDAVRKFGPSW